MCNIFHVSTFFETIHFLCYWVQLNFTRMVIKHEYEVITVMWISPSKYLRSSRKHSGGKCAIEIFECPNNVNVLLLRRKIVIILFYKLNEFFATNLNMTSHIVYCCVIRKLWRYWIITYWGYIIEIVKFQTLYEFVFHNYLDELLDFN